MSELERIKILLGNSAFLPENATEEIVRKIRYDLVYLKHFGFEVEVVVEEDKTSKEGEVSLILDGAGEFNFAVEKTIQLLRNSAKPRPLWGAYASLTQLTFVDDETGILPLSPYAIIVAVRNAYKNMWLGPYVENIDNMPFAARRVLWDAFHLVETNRGMNKQKPFEEETSLATRIIREVQSAYKPFLHRLHHTPPQRM